MAKRFKQTTETETLGTLLSYAHSELDTLREEMVEWRDNMDNAEMSHLPKYDEVNEVAEMLDYLVDDFEPEEVARELEAAGVNMDAKVSYTVYAPYGKRAASRAMRRDNAVVMLDASASEARSQTEEINTKRQNEYDDMEDAEREKVDQPEDVDEEPVAQIESLQEEVQNIDFPGMFG